MNQQEELFIFCQEPRRVAFKVYEKDCFNALALRLDQISEHIEALAVLFGPKA